jgi:hypothetical protein
VVHCERLAATNRLGRRLPRRQAAFQTKHSNVPTFYLFISQQGRHSGLMAGLARNGTRL